MAKTPKSLLVFCFTAAIFYAPLTVFGAGNYSSSDKHGGQGEQILLAASRGAWDALSMERELRDTLSSYPPFSGTPQESAERAPPAPAASQDYMPQPEAVPSYAPQYTAPAQSQPAYGSSPSYAPPPSYAVPSQQLSVQDYYQNGSRFFAEQRWYFAIDQFSRAIELDQRFAKAYAVRALAYAALGHFDKAVNDSTIALAINPRLAFAYETRAIGHYARNRYNEAWNDVRTAQSLGHSVDPGFLGNLRRASGRRN